MDFMDIITGVLTVAVVIAALFFPIKRDHMESGQRQRESTSGSSAGNQKKTE